jgi:hypothetical protein
MSFDASALTGQIESFMFPPTPLGKGIPLSGSLSADDRAIAVQFVVQGLSTIVSELVREVDRLRTELAALQPSP